MKAVLMAIHRKWCEKIFRGEKTVEVRKIAPNLETPYKVYVYQTKNRGGAKIINDCPNSVYGGGKVVGEFVCNEKEYFTVGSLRCDEIEELACLSYQEMIEYFYKPEELDGKTVKAGTALHITEPKLYDKPKELEVFWSVRCTNKKGDCQTCEVKPACINNITRPPQSWCYVEEIKE